ncbi:hypothetical protein QQX98_000889 [Neonectria punicea]|uniref:NB-ARC domain-containing protein n=1 Tax=Neonectria punicea TaxID=979145 RepID=A0ABR1HRB1_9HYPO
MAEAFGLAVNIMTVIELSAKVATLCLDYSKAVGNAKEDITRLRNRLDGLARTLQGVHRLLAGPDARDLPTSQDLFQSVDQCTLELVKLQSRLDPGKTRKTMRRLGLRALKWPFDSNAINETVSNLNHYERTVTLGLQVDQTTLLLDIRQKMEGVSLQSQDSKPASHGACFHVPFPPDPDFIDRPDIMTWMEEQFSNHITRIALVGMGGFGKSQLAIRFAYQVREKSPQTSVFWVYASSKPRFEEAYRSIADRLELPQRNDPGVDVLGLVRDYLQRDNVGPWLMILDNVDDVNLFHPSPSPSVRQHKIAKGSEDVEPAISSPPLASFLPKSSNGSILVTSRNLDAAEKLIGSHKCIQNISTMTESQALQLFQTKLLGECDEAAADLLRALDYIPLAITQAAGYINRRAPRISVRTYLNNLQKNDKKKGSLLNTDGGDLRRDEAVSNSVVITWQVTFEQIRRERPSAADLLSFMSFFNPQGIPESILRSYKSAMTEESDSDESADETSDQPDNSDDDDDEFEEDLDILRGLQGRLDESESLLAHNMEVAARVLGTDHPTTLDVTGALASTYWALGRYKEAEDLEVGIVEWSKRVLGEEHPTTLTRMHNIASTYLDQGRLEDAEALQVQVMQTHKRVLGEEHPDTLTSMANLGSTYHRQGRLEEAEALGVQVMQTHKRVLGEEHPNTLMSMANLGSTYHRQGRLEEAEALGVQVMQIHKRVVGEEHPDTLTSMANLGSTYHRQGRLEEAEALDVQVMQTHKRVLGEEHPDTLMSMASLGQTFYDQGRLEEAEALEVQALNGRERVLGEEDPATMSSMHNLAFTWKQQGHLEKAIGLMRRCAALRDKVLGSDHPATANSLLLLRDWEDEGWEDEECGPAEMESEE